MGSFFSEYRKSAVSAVVFFVTLVGVSYAYATFTALTNVVSGGQLKAVDWNAMVADLNDLNSRAVPTGAVMAFYGTSCPTGWAAADGTANGVKMTDGTSGTLDLRGEFIRGLDTAGAGSRGVDSGRTLASWQKPSISTYHSDGNSTAILTSPMDAGNSANSTYGVEDANSNGYSSSTLTRAESVASSSYTYATSLNNGYYKALRPRNVALLYCVKN